MALRRTRSSPARSGAGSVSTYSSTSTPPGFDTRIARMVTSLPRRVEFPLDGCNALLVALVEGPLLDPLRPQQPRVHEDAEVLARRRLTHAKLVGDEYPAHAVAHE